VERSHSGISQSCFGSVGLTVATGVAYFLAARLSLALRVDPGVAIFWPASGIALGALIALGPKARLPLAVAVVLATAASNVMIGRNPWLAMVFGLLNASQTLFTAWLLERRFERAFNLEGVQRVLVFLAAAAVGSALAATGAAIAIAIYSPTASPLQVWGLWFAASSLGIVTVAPLLIGLGDAMRERLARHEQIEGWAGLFVVAAVTAFLVSLPDGPWATALPEALVFPFLLWIAIRCRPVFAAGAALTVGLTIIGSATLNIGYFDSGKPIAERILSAQIFVFMEAILVVLLAAVFAEKRRSEKAVKEVAERLQLALDGAVLGAFSADLATGQFACDERAGLFNGHTAPPTTIEESRRFVHPEDLSRIEDAIAEAQLARGNWKVEYRVIPPAGHLHAGETRWVAVEGSIVRDDRGAPAQLFGVTRDITLSKLGEQALAERNTQLALAGKVGLIGSFAFDIATGRMQVSPGYAAIHGLPEGTLETTRADWRVRVHPDDVPCVDACLRGAIANRDREHHCEYRVVRADGESRWIEARCSIAYDPDGRARRVVGANIDVTERKHTEAVLKESKIRLADALAAGQVMAFQWDAITGESVRSNNASLMVGDDQHGGARQPRNEFLRQVHPEDQQRLKTCIRQLQPDRPSYAVTFRLVRADGSKVWLEETAKGEFDGSGRLLRIKGLTRDISERKRTELALSERTMQLELAGKAALVGSFAFDVEAEKMQISEGYAAIHGFPEGTTEIARSQWHAGVHADDRREVEAAQRGAFRQRRNEYGIEYRIHRRSGEVRWIEKRSFIAYRCDGRPERVVGVNIDITERKRAHQHQCTLLAELDHRVKNVLATVSTVAARTMDGSNSIHDFVASLEGRISSMARTHELLSATRWQGISVLELVRRELAPYATRGNTDISGPEVIVRAEAGQALGMVLHELATNAAKYGALSKQNGRVSIGWQRLQNGHPRSRLILLWSEVGGPSVMAPQHSGFGMSTIRDLIPYEFGGTVDLAFAPSGVRCRLEIPADWLIANAEPPSKAPAHAFLRARDPELETS
jgi:PAS domain S-box-containing protein